MKIKSSKNYFTFKLRTGALAIPERDNKSRREIRDIFTSEPAIITESSFWNKILENLG